MTAQRYNRIAEGYGLLRAGILDGRRDAAAYGLPAWRGRDKPGFQSRPYGYSSPTELWLDAYKREYTKAYARRILTLSQSEVEELDAQAEQNRAIRLSKEPDLLQEVVDLRKRVEVLEQN
jgi:hypothetical protein